MRETSALAAPEKAKSASSGSEAPGAEWQSRLGALLNDDSNRARKNLVAAFVGQKKDKASGYDYLRALDHCLQTIGSGLVDFWTPPDTAWDLTPPAPLRVWEVRSFVPWSTGWPYEVPENIVQHGRKAVVKDIRNGKKKFELQEYNIERPMLALITDEGSKFFACCWFLTGGLKLRTVWLRDPFHRGWRDWNLAVDHSGWKAVKYQGCLIMNLRHGPWLSSSWWQQTLDGAELHLQESNMNDELFNVFYMPMLRDRRLAGEVGVGSPDHMAALRASVCASKIFQTKGDKVAMRSFWKWIRSMKEFLPHWHEFLMTLLVLGLKSGWFKNGQVPYLHGDAAAGAVEVPEVRGDDVDAAPSASGCNDDKTLKQLRDSCANSCHVAAVLLASDQLHFACKVISELSEPLQIAHDLHVQQMKGAESVELYYIGCAQGEVHETLLRVLRQLRDPKKLEFLDFDIDIVSIKGCSKKHDKMSEFITAKCTEEQSSADALWKFLLNVVKWRSLSMCHYRHGFPGMFALLISSDTRIVAQGLALAKEAWEALVAMEAIRHTDTVAMNLLDAIPFSQWIVVRETLVGLAQWDFKWVPPPILDVWRTVFRSWGQTLVCEDAFNAVKDHQRDSKNLRLSRNRRFYIPVTSKTIATRYHRAEVTPEPQHRQGPARLTETVFESQAVKSTIPDEHLAAIQDANPEWSSFSPISASTVPAAFQLLLACHRAGKLDGAAGSWRSMFAVEGSLIRNRNAEHPFLVLAVNQFGFLGWPCTIGDGEYEWQVFDFGLDHSAGQAAWHAVDDFEQWLVYKVELRGPWACVCKLGMPLAVPTLNLISTSPSVPMLEAACHFGFKGVSEKYLDKLIADLGIILERKGSVKSVLAKVELLIRRIVPGLSDEGVHRCLLWRCKSASTAAEKLLAKFLENASVGPELLEGNDDKDLKQVVRDTKNTSDIVREYVASKKKVGDAAVVGKGSTTLAHAGSQPVGASSSSARPCALRPIEPHKWPEHVQQAKSMLPKKTGCIMQPYPKKRAFQVYYPNPAPPGSTTFTYAAPGCHGYSEGECLAASVRWAWTCHTRETGEMCPFVFAE